ncbi:hypothetical protein [Caballeronia sp. M23-90]|jgi:hypothetical protein
MSGYFRKDEFVTDLRGAIDHHISILNWLKDELGSEKSDEYYLAFNLAAMLEAQRAVEPVIDLIKERNGQSSHRSN